MYLSENAVTRPKIFHFTCAGLPRQPIWLTAYVVIVHFLNESYSHLLTLCVKYIKLLWMSLERKLKVLMGMIIAYVNVVQDI